MVNDRTSITNGQPVETTGILAALDRIEQGVRHVADLYSVQADGIGTMANHLADCDYAAEYDELREQAGAECAERCDAEKLLDLIRIALRVPRAARPEGRNRAEMLRGRRVHAVLDALAQGGPAAGIAHLERAIAESPITYAVAADSGLPSRAR